MTHRLVGKQPSQDGMRVDFEDSNVIVTATSIATADRGHPILDLPPRDAH